MPFLQRPKLAREPTIVSLPNDHAQRVSEEVYIIVTRHVDFLKTGWDCLVVISNQTKTLVIEDHSSSSQNVVEDKHS
jgi:hypothetical protein